MEAVEAVVLLFDGVCAVLAVWKVWSMDEPSSRVVRRWLWHLSCVRQVPGRLFGRWEDKRQ